eukprot:TRINITY_DN4152_c0_g1_i7.p1 TRINITY_DN4152_c0_g1~~TRINITY_DN4152_c0_g1_i7.p1  ORF type:complete len:159 (-),score=23.28 TRINITY_DN4152_c0_g1_i7:141-617(-)
MFAVLVAGRLVQTNSTQVDATKLLFSLERSDTIHNLAVFLTGVSPLPPDAGAIVWLSYPPYDSWQYLGHLTNEKPSAMFRVHQNTTSPHTSNQFGQFGRNHEIRVNEAKLGVELAPIFQIEHQFGSYDSKKLTPQQQENFAQKLAEGVFNYLASFSQV